ncbi:AAA family ATPase [Marinobacter adhaerens]|jgi:energy-coupling factor transporter ATP-binding protein EcfA2|uniref:AAA family ATPase n=1 Tax=Marinobacter adhaerens TaxID=1033846 RepID=UPI001E4507D2|nr:AAA family ATPase [Marinobacter adhaerens]MCD1645735.1 AAA family ATPase [Marinobacter adhaerens]
MRIQSIIIENFRAIESVEIRNLSDAVVVAGPNGCGKSSIFDAIRLVKSAYGQYSNNEFGSWFSEFQINVNKLQSESKRILNDPRKPLKIEIEFNISEYEKGYIRENAVDIFKKMRWSQISRQRSLDGDVQIRDPRTKLQDGVIVDRDAANMAAAVLEVIDRESHLASLTMAPGDSPSVIGAPVLELIFSIYQPQDIGVIDYQSPSRTYSREQVSNLSLQIQDASASKGAQHALYNTQNKYTGVKTEMAQSYVRELLAEKAGVPVPEENTLKSTLDELFSIFFPGKRFMGAIPTKEGGLEFPVELENGRRHDINELSSGEKEVLLGYLRLRNNAPKNSIILLDEPELHLNPRLAMGLPRFYQKHLGEMLNNQIWLVSHSDAILREAVQDPSYSVFHMQPSAQTPSGSNQAEQISASIDLENAIISLVGDLATYNPRSKVVLLEGENSEIDARIISELLPYFSERVNLVSVGSKRNVRNAHDFLQKAADKGRLDARFYSIVDRDFENDEIVQSDRQFQWDVYHVENFLLEAKYIKESLASLSLGDIDLSEEQIKRELKECAIETADEIIRIRMDKIVNSKFISAISFSFDPKLKSSQGFSEAVSRSHNKISELVESSLSFSELEALEIELRSSLNEALSGDDWVKVFRGRNILKRFAGKKGISYEVLRNLVVSRMRLAQYCPDNMREISEIILNG